MRSVVIWTILNMIISLNISFRLLVHILCPFVLGEHGENLQFFLPISARQGCLCVSSCHGECDLISSSYVIIPFPHSLSPSPTPFSPSLSVCHQMAPKHSHLLHLVLRETGLQHWRENGWNWSHWRTVFPDCQGSLSHCNSLCKCWSLNLPFSYATTLNATVFFSGLPKSQWNCAPPCFCGSVPTEPGVTFLHLPQAPSAFSDWKAQMAALRWEQPPSECHSTLHTTYSTSALPVSWPSVPATHLHSSVSSLRCLYAYLCLDSPNTLAETQNCFTD